MNFQIYTQVLLFHSHIITLSKSIQDVILTYSYYNSLYENCLSHAMTKFSSNYCIKALISKVSAIISGFSSSDTTSD
jgi:hypothetical protein